MMFWTLPIPTVTIQLGWMAAEAGRQPWIVYGLMRTRDGVSKVVSAPEVLFSIILFSAIYLLLGSLWIYLLRREVLHGPEQSVEPMDDLVNMVPEPGVVPAGAAV
jgi:cytochrome d ubiquinol oxidase subunit I